MINQVSVFTSFVALISISSSVEISLQNHFYIFLKWFLETYNVPFGSHGYSIKSNFGLKKVMGFKSGYLPFGIQQWGPIGKSANKSGEIFKALDQFPGFFKKVDICFHRPKDWDVKKENWHFKNFRLQRFSLIPNYEVTLSNDYEKVYNGFSNQAKRNLKSSSKYELTMFEYDTPDT